VPVVHILLRQSGCTHDFHPSIFVDHFHALLDLLLFEKLHDALLLPLEICDFPAENAEPPLKDINRNDGAILLIRSCRRRPEALIFRIKLSAYNDYPYAVICNLAGEKGSALLFVFFFQINNLQVQNSFLSSTAFPFLDVLLPLSFLSAFLPLSSLIMSGPP
jgi:hypothetical protein